MEIPFKTFLDPYCVPDHHQNLIILLLGTHPTPPKMSSKRVDNFLSYSAYR